MSAHRKHQSSVAGNKACKKFNEFQVVTISDNDDSHFPVTSSTKRNRACNSFTEVNDNESVVSLSKELPPSNYLNDDALKNPIFCVDNDSEDEGEVKKPPWQLIHASSSLDSNELKNLELVTMEVDSSSSACSEGNAGMDISCVKISEQEDQCLSSDQDVISVADDDIIYLGSVDHNVSSPVEMMPYSETEKVIPSSESEKVRPSIKHKTKSCINHGKKNYSGAGILNELQKSEFGKCLRDGVIRAYKEMENDCVIIALEPNKGLYMEGFLWLQVVVGEVKVFGYTMKEDEERVLFSPKSHSLMYFEASVGKKYASVKSNKILPTNWCHSINVEDADTVTIVRLRQYWSPFVQLLLTISTNDIYKQRLLSLSKSHLKTADPIWSGMYEKCNMLKQPKEWENVVNMIIDIHNAGEIPCVVLCGGKGKGKSTLLKYLINRWLTLHNQGVVEAPHIGCLDLDPGQSEFSLPGTLSVTEINCPLLGPAYTRYESAFSGYKKDLLFGALSPNYMLENYMEYVAALMEDYQSSNINVPLLVNTMGWTKGPGLNIIVDVIRVVKPNVVVQIGDRNGIDNFSCDLTCQFVNSYIKGIVTSGNEISVNYDHIFLSVAAKKTVNSSSFSKFYRDLNMLGYFSPLAESAFFGSELSKIFTVVIPWSSVALHALHTPFEMSRILLIINASLVALCQVPKDKIEDTGHDLPKRISAGYNSKYTSVIGWAIVRAVDPLMKMLHLLTPLKEETVRALVNAVIISKVELPDTLSCLLSSGSGPYCFAGERAPGSKSSVGRQYRWRKFGMPLNKD